MGLGSNRLTSANSPKPERPLSDLEACHIIKIIFAALVASVPACEPEEWRELLRVRGAGRVAPNDFDDSPEGQRMVSELMKVMDALEDEMALSLARRLCRAIATRFCLPEPASGQADDGEENEVISPYERKTQAIARIMRYLTLNRLPIRGTIIGSQLSIWNGVLMDVHDLSTTSGLFFWLPVLEWLRTVILKEWDGNPWVPKCSAITGALEMLFWMCESRCLASSSGILTDLP